jgi:RNA polymerase sigma-70 factor (ECF subfamily)
MSTDVRTIQLDALTLSVKANCFDEPALPQIDRGARAAERSLLESAVAGDRDAFRQLIEMHRERVERFAMRLTGYRCDVDDVVHDVFVIALENLKRFRAQSSFATWLMKLTISRCRRERLRRMLMLKFVRSSAPQVEARGDAQAEQREHHEKIRRAVSQLPQNLREVIVLRYLEELEVEEICALLSLSRSAFDVRLHRGRERLRALLEP